jgi:hypothetical protein
MALHFLYYIFHENQIKKSKSLAARKPEGWEAMKKVKVRRSEGGKKAGLSTED